MVNALNSSGNASESISNTDGAMPGGKPAMEEALPAQQQHGRSESVSSWLALEDALRIFQEDLRVLQTLGVAVKVVPMIEACGCPAVVLPGVRFVDGDFVAEEGRSDG